MIIQSSELSKKVLNSLLSAAFSGLGLFSLSAFPADAQSSGSPSITQAQYKADIAFDSGGHVNGTYPGHTASSDEGPPTGVPNNYI
jgi:hypothetical protein